MKETGTSLVAALAALLGGLWGCGPATAPAAATPPADPAGAEPAEAEPAGPFLWEVSGPETAAPSYLLGTVHMGVSARELPDPVWEAWRATDTFIMEADLRDVSPMEMMQQAMLPEDESLREMLGPAYWERLVEAAEGTLPAAMLERLQPWMLTTMLTMDATETRMLDMELLSLASEGGKELVFLESAQDQIHALKDSSGLEDLQELLDDLEGARQKLQDLVEAYRAGDLQGVMDHVLDPEELAADPESMDALLFDRNRAWIPALERHLQRGGAFVAAGLGHYPGEQGVIELLRERGYEVRRLAGGTPPLVAERTPPVSTRASREQCELLLRRQIASDPELEGADEATLEERYEARREAFVAECTEKSAVKVKCALEAPDAEAASACDASR